MTALYEMTTQLKQLQNIDAENENEELAIQETLDLIEGDFEEKANAIIQFVNSLDKTMVEPIDYEIKRLQQRKKTLQNRQKQMRDYLRQNMQASGINKIESPFFTITLAKARQVVHVTDESALPDSMISVKTEIKPNKTEILKALKEGEEVPGAELVYGETSLRIK